MQAGFSPIGTNWQDGISVWEKQCRVTDKTGQTILLTDSVRLSELLSTQPPLEHFTSESFNRFCSCLHTELAALQGDFLDAIQLEAAFNRSDCEEIVQSCLGYVKGFPEYFESLAHTGSRPIYYGEVSRPRRIDQAALPWGTIAAIIPQNAFLFLSLTCILNALAVGNRMILRAPSQSARSAELLCIALERSQPSSGSVSVATMPARPFMAALCESPEPMLVHYLGSSAHAPEILSSCFQAGKQCLIDGEGNTWVWVDEDVPVEYAVDIITSGALRYNGQTCTSVNGAVIHPRIYEQVEKQLAKIWGEITFGNPLESGVRVGPLMSEAQAKRCLASIEQSGAKMLAGGYRQGNLLAPTLAAQPRRDSELVAEGFFGSALWIMPGDFDEFASLWKRNRYPLCAGILSQHGNVDLCLRELPNLARLVVNADPSIEHIYEPWGGYSGSGTNAVGHWYHKYLQTVQIDRAA